MPSANNNSDNESFIGTVLLVISILFTIAIGLWHTYPPKPVTDEAADSVFSSNRAIKHVRHIGLRPHPTGTTENTYIRHYLSEQISALGYTPITQSALVVIPDKQKMARIHNMMVRVPGTKSGKAVLIAAHYDSVPTGPGAADDGASVAAMLEVLRALKFLPPLANDVIFLFTDGEEMGLFGAEALVSQHPWAKETGLALNFEYRGNRGAFLMFETSTGNGKLIEGLANTKTAIWTNSLMYEVYKRLPNDTDFTVLKNLGIPGMNFAAIVGHTAYHTALDLPEFLDEGSLQQEGEIMLALVRQFGNTPLDNLKSEDRIYFDLPGIGLIHYPSSWAIPINIILAFLFAVVVALSCKRKQIRTINLLISPFIFMVVLLGLASGSQLIWKAVMVIHPEYDSFFQGDTYNSHWYLPAFVLLTISLFGFLQKLADRWFTKLECFLGAAFCWLVLAITCGFLLPGVSYLCIWPLLNILIAITISLIPAGKISTKALTIYWYFIGSIPGLLFFTPLIKGLYTGLTPQMIGVVIACLVLLFGLLIPVFASLYRQKTLYTTLFLFSLLSFAAGSATSGFDIEHPRQDTLFYAVASNLKRAYWLSADKQLDQWTQTFFENQKEKHRVPEIFGEDSPISLWSADAPVLPLPPPQINTVADSHIDGKRILKLKIKSIRHSPKLSVAIEGVDVVSSHVAGQVYTKDQQSNWRLDSFGLRDEDLLIDLTVKPGVPFTLRTTDYSYGLPETKLTIRPADTIPKPGEYSDTIAVVNTVRF